MMAWIRLLALPTSKGTLYGVASRGGNVYSCGTIFSITTSGTFNVPAQVLFL